MHIILGILALACLYCMVGYWVGGDTDLYWPMMGLLVFFGTFPYSLLLIPIALVVGVVALGVYLGCWIFKRRHAAATTDKD